MSAQPETFRHRFHAAARCKPRQNHHHCLCPPPCFLISCRNFSRALGLPCLRAGGRVSVLRDGQTFGPRWDSGQLCPVVVSRSGIPSVPRRLGCDQRSPPVAALARYTRRGDAPTLLMALRPLPVNCRTFSHCFSASVSRFAMPSCVSASRTEGSTYAGAGMRSVLQSPQTRYGRSLHSSTAAAAFSGWSAGRPNRKTMLPRRLAKSRMRSQVSIFMPSPLSSPCPSH